MNDRPIGVAGGYAVTEPEPRKHCWHCSRSYTEDDVQIIWAEQNCTRWSTCPFNLTDEDPQEREDAERRAYPWPPVRGEDY